MGGKALVINAATKARRSELKAGLLHPGNGTWVKGYVLSRYQPVNLSACHAPFLISVLAFLFLIVSPLVHILMAHTMQV